MGFFSTLLNGLLRSGSQGAASVIAIPGLAAAAEVLVAIAIICDNVPQNKSAARQLAYRCQRLYDTLEQYEKTPIPDRTTKYRAEVFRCLQEVRTTMHKWSEKNWFHLLLHQGDFEAAIDECGDKISDCLATFTAAAHIETLARQKEDEKWKRDLRESLDADHQALLKEFAAANFVQRATESKVIESQTDFRTLSIMMQKCLGERRTISKEEHDRMASNLYDLLRLSKQLPPVHQLDSGEVEWSDKIPVAGGRNVDIYKGRYLQREDVMIKVIRTINPKDERNVERIRREVELWAKIYDMDQGKHIIPFYGFCTTDGLRLALVSPWIDNGDALTYVKKHNKLINYKKLILGIAEGIQVLHSMDPPIIHGDLKAEKVLIGEEGQPLITDFALAKLEGNLITQTAGVSDGYRWSAPEMCIEPGTVSTKSDIYSFGMTILELFTHDKPYANLKRGAQVIKKIDNRERPDRPQDASAMERGLDDKMWELLCLCWAQDSQDRPSIDELVAQLRSPGVHTVVNML